MFREQKTGRRIPLGFAGVLLALTLAWPAAHAAEDSAGVDDRPVIEYTLIHHMLEDADPTPLLRVFGDGRVRVHYPIYMTRAGDYATQLSPAELSDLLSSMAGTGVLNLDLDRARLLRQRVQDGALHHVSDVTETVIRIRLSADSTRAPGVPAGAIDTTVRWPNVYNDRRRFPDLAPVATIDAAEQRLRALLERPDLARVQP